LSVIGSLEDLAFPDVLQIIHASRRSGTLILSLRDGERRVRFRNGLICGATLGSGGPEIEELLRRRGHVDARALAQATARAGRTGETVAEALVGLTAVSQETMDRVVREELKSSLRSIILSQEGEFRFELEEERRPPAETVLLLAERSVLRRVLEEDLRRGGFEVIACANSAEALEHARKLAGGGRSFLLVSDLVLPDASGNGWLGGLDLLRAVRRLSPQAGGVLLGDLRERGAAAARAAGATAYLPLPDLGRTELEEVGTVLARFGALVRDAALHPDRVPGPGGSAREPVLAVDHVSLLRGLVGELHAEEEIAIPLLVLRLAAEYFERGVLFSVRDHEVLGTGAFGGESGESGNGLDGRVRGAALPLLAGSALEMAVRTRAPYVGPVDGDTNAPLIARLGAPPPQEAALLPVSAGRQVFAVLYGDNARSARPVGDLRGLEIFVAQAGIALHNAALQRRLSELSAGVSGSGAHA
jgi:CheY-like chemotaxis protein